MDAARPHLTTIRRSVAILVAAVCCGGLGASGVALASPGPRVTIALYGDSVVEGYTIPHFLRDALIPRVRASLGAAGFQTSGLGFIPASIFRWHFSAYTVAGTSQVPRADAWTLAGFGAMTPGLDGLSGYSAISLSPDVTASAPIDPTASSVGVLFTKFDGSGVFTVTAGGQTFSIDARSSGPPTATVQWITVPAGTKTITVHGAQTGSLIFGGVINRGTVSQGKIGVEVENLGHMGHRLEQDAAPRILQAIVQQRFDISVFDSAYIWEFAATSGGSAGEKRYAAELRARAGLVRGYGGICLIADPTPLPTTLGKIIPRFIAIDKQVAKEQGCTYTNALSHLWNPSSAVQDGLTVIDGVHPRAPGYRLMASALTPILVKMIRQRIRTRGF